HRITDLMARHCLELWVLFEKIKQTGVVESCIPAGDVEPGEPLAEVAVQDLLHRHPGVLEDMVVEDDEPHLDRGHAPSAQGRASGAGSPLCTSGFAPDGVAFGLSASQRLQSKSGCGSAQSRCVARKWMRGDCRSRSRSP